MEIVTRKEYLTEQVVFVDGISGCGKTLLSPLVSSLERVELINYVFEIEKFCQLHTFKKLSLDAAKSLIEIHVDLKLYNTMMSRDLNFRPADISSALKAHNSEEYIQRLFSKGDDEVPDIIKEKKPILNCASHNLMAYSIPIWESFGDRVVMIQVIRHPLYMVRQNIVNFENTVNSPKDFTLHYLYNNSSLPYFVKGWEEDYLNSNSVERTIYYLDNLIKLTNKTKKKVKDDYQAKVITVPFEQLALNPGPWLDKIAKIIGTKVNDSTRKVMQEQNVPRDKVAQGIDLEVYRRCGWVPPKNGTNERDELNIRREDFTRAANSDAIAVLDQLSLEYEEKYWNPDL
jgi:hypothetical protein